MVELKLEIAEVNQILLALSKQPWDVANPLMIKLQEQAKQQEKKDKK